MGQGLLPPADWGNLDIEMFMPPTGVITPSERLDCTPMIGWLIHQR